MSRSFNPCLLFVALMLISVFSLLPDCSRPACAQSAKEQKGSYVFMNGTLGIGGVSNNLYIQGDILGAFESNGEYSSRPTGFWVKNTGTKPCFISGEQTGFTVGSAGSEIKPGETLHSGLAIYRPKGSPILAIDITLKAWIPAKPEEPKMDPLQARKLTEAQAMFEDSMQRYEAMKEHLQAGGTAWGQLPDAERDNAVHQQMDELTAKMKQATESMGKFMEGYKRGDFSGLDDVLPALNKINSELEEQVKQLRVPAPQKTALSTPPAISTTSLLLPLFGKQYTFISGEPRTGVNECRGKLELLPHRILRYTFGIWSGDSDHVVNLSLDNLYAQYVTVEDYAFDDHTHDDQYVTIDYAEIVPTPARDDIGPSSANKIEIAKSATSLRGEALKTEFIKLIQGVADKPVEPVHAIAMADPQLMQNLQSALTALALDTTALPKQGDSVSSLGTVPLAVRSQYARIMNGMEGKNIAAVSKSLAPDYFYKDADGTVLSLSKWKAAQTALLRQFPRPHILVQAESQEPSGNDLVVTATRTIRNTGGDTAGARLEQKLKETWTPAAAGDYVLQSTEVISENKTNFQANPVPDAPPAAEIVGAPTLPALPTRTKVSLNRSTNRASSRRRPFSTVISKTVASVTLSKPFSIASLISVQHNPGMDANLLYTSGQDDLPTFQRMLQKGGNVHARSKDGTTALMQAADHNRLSTLKLVLSLRADANAANDIGMTALMFASRSGAVDAMRELLTSGANVDAKNTSGVTALMLAVKAHQAEAVRVLLGNRAAVSALDNWGNTALMLAAAEGQNGVVQSLLDAHADVTTRNGAGKTALGIAVAKGHEAVAAQLRTAGGFE